MGKIAIMYSNMILDQKSPGSTPGRSTERKTTCKIVSGFLFIRPQRETKSIQPGFSSKP
jgi:hypothetical protein